MNESSSSHSVCKEPHQGGSNNKQYKAHSMKQDFCIQMEALLGQDEANMLTQAIEQSTPPVSVRVNALKPPACPPGQGGKPARMSSRNYCSQQVLSFVFLLIMYYFAHTYANLSAKAFGE